MPPMPEPYTTTHAPQGLSDRLADFLRHEVTGGILLSLAALAGLVAANSSLAPAYENLLQMRLSVHAGIYGIEKPLLLWINDALMALFFLLVGLELKREVLEGELSRPDQILLPALAALGGMVAPAVIYALFNRGDPVGIHGWAIPSATDIAFALGALALLGPRVPPALKVFLMTLAVLDDLGAIVIIALFYTANLVPELLWSVSLPCVAVLWLLNRFGVRLLFPYWIVGLVLWASVLKSGVHATLAAVVLAQFIPLRGGRENSEPPLVRIEHELQPLCALFVLPLFAFANAGVSLAGVGLAQLGEGVALGIALGLLAGKPIGVFGVSALAIRMGWARMPSGVTRSQLFGVSLLCGVGFTMSLFIGSLAFEHAGMTYQTMTRLGILVSSGLAVAAGYVWLKGALR